MKGMRSSSYSAFLDSSGEMLYAVNDMSIIENLNPDFLESRGPILENADSLVLDANLSEESLNFLCREYGGKILLIDPVSAMKIGKLKNTVGTARIFKPNIVETEAFTGIRLNEDSDFTDAMNAYHESGIEKIFISAGARGIFYSDGKMMGLSPSLPVQIKSVTGAGDAASAALILSSIMDLNAATSAALANLTAASSLLSSGTINRQLSLTYLEKLSKELKYEPFLS